MATTQIHVLTILTAVCDESQKFKGAFLIYQIHNVLRFVYRNKILKM